jgi:hypothetical protein
MIFKLKNIISIIAYKKMTIPFYTLNIHEPLQQMLYDADNSGEWQAIINYCEPIIETTEEDGVILCYTFALIEQAKAIHIDDVEQTGIYCLELLKRLKHTTGGTDHWTRMIKKLLRADKDLKNKENRLTNVPYESLTLSEKTKLAYNLQGKGVENEKRAAEIHWDLYEMKKHTAESYYHLGNYIMCLYGSNQIEFADEKFHELNTFMSANPNHGYAFLISNCYQEKIIHYLDDVEQTRKIWDKAINHPAVISNHGFPISEIIQDKLLIAANQLGLEDIKKYLSAMIIAERKPRMITDEIKKIIGI